MARLFIAIELPDQVKQALIKLQTPVPGAKWVPLDQLHLTLAFLGEVDETTGGHLFPALSSVGVPPFTLHFSGVGCFPDRRRPRVLWVGLEKNPLLDSLAAQVRSAVLECGIPQEERPFSPHITLARLRQPAGHEVVHFLDQPLTHELPKVAVGEFILFQSRLTAAGALHTPLNAFALGPGR